MIYQHVDELEESRESSIKKPSLPVKFEPLTPNDFSASQTQNMIESEFKKNQTDLGSGSISGVATSIYEQSIKYGYDPLFILAIIKTESSFLTNAVSEKGARGLMQIVPTTGKYMAEQQKKNWEGHESLHSPIYNIEMGTYYFTKLFKRFDGDLVTTLEAYNNGPTRIRKLIDTGKKPNYIYTKRVLNNYKDLLHTYKWNQSQS
jgi:soluble lytic murein transglycosylase-like protein